MLATRRMRLSDVNLLSDVAPANAKQSKSAAHTNSEQQESSGFQFTISHRTCNILLFIIVVILVVCLRDEPAQWLLHKSVKKPRDPFVGYSADWSDDTQDLSIGSYSCYLEQPLGVELWRSHYAEASSVLFDCIEGVIHSNESNWFNIGFDLSLNDFLAGNASYEIELVASYSKHSTVQHYDEYDEKGVDFAIGFTTVDVIDGDAIDSTRGPRDIGKYSKSWSYLPLYGEIHQSGGKNGHKIRHLQLNQDVKLVFHDSRVDIIIEGNLEETVDLQMYHLHHIRKSTRHKNIKKGRQSKKNKVEEDLVYYPAISMFGKGLQIKINYFNKVNY